jgi:hypothetical protein
MAALARVTANPTTFVLLAGDTFHNAAEVRPSPDLNKKYPVPASILSSSQSSISREFFVSPLDTTDLSNRTIPFLDVASVGFNSDPVRTKVSQFDVQVFDVDEDILVVSAHDPSYEGLLEMFPKGSLNDWKEKGWKGRGVWQFGNATSPAFVLGLKPVENEGTREGGTGRGESNLLSAFRKQTSEVIVS